MPILFNELNRPDQGTLTEAESFNTVDHLALACLDKLLLTLKALFTFLQKQATLMRRSTVLSLS